MLGVLQYGHCCNWPDLFSFACAFADIRPLRLWFLQLQLKVAGLISEMCAPDVSRFFVVHVPTHPSTRDVAGEAINCPAASRNEQMTGHK